MPALPLAALTLPDDYQELQPAASNALKVLAQSALDLGLALQPSTLSGLLLACKRGCRVSGVEQVGGRGAGGGGCKEEPRGELVGWGLKGSGWDVAGVWLGPGWGVSCQG